MEGKKQLIAVVPTREIAAKIILYLKEDYLPAVMKPGYEPEIIDGPYVLKDGDFVHISLVFKTLEDKHLFGQKITESIASVTRYIYFITGEKPADVVVDA